MTAFIVRCALFGVGCIMLGWACNHHRIHPALALAIIIFVLTLAGGDLVP